MFGEMTDPLVSTRCRSNNLWTHLLGIHVSSTRTALMSVKPPAISGLNAPSSTQLECYRFEYHEGGRSNFQDCGHWRRIVLVPERSCGDPVSQPRPRMLCTRSTAFYLGTRYRRCVAMSRCSHHPGNMMQSSTIAVSEWYRANSGLYNCLGDHECLDLAGVWYMRSDTEIYHRSTTIHSGRCAVWNLGLDQVLFVFVVLWWY